MHADVFLAGAVSMLNRNFGAPLIMSFQACLLCILGDITIE